MNIDLLNKEIDDKFVRENFSRIKSFLEALRILDGYWEFFEKELPAAGTKIKLKHNLSFVPKDIILLSVYGDQRVYFNYMDFTDTNIIITNQGPCRIRFLAGHYRGKAYGGAYSEFPFVAP